jgi:hypothetical protein
MSLANALSGATLVLVSIYLVMGFRIWRQQAGSTRVPLPYFRLVISALLINSLVSLAHFESPTLDVIGRFLALMLAAVGTILFLLSKPPPIGRRLTSR